MIVTIDYARVMKRGELKTFENMESKGLFMYGHSSRTEDSSQ